MEPDYSGHHIYLTRLIDGAWTEPVEAPFTGGKEATAPHFTPDGRSVLFIASWAADGAPREGDAREGNVWRATWDGTRWGEPQLLPAPINSPATEIDVVEVNEPEEIFPAYKHAFERTDNRSTMIIEDGNFYNEK